MKESMLLNSFLILVMAAGGCSRKNRKAYPLHEAVEIGDGDEVEALINSGADVNAKNNQGWTPLHIVLDKDIAAILVANGADVNAKDKYGWTPLHAAVGTEHGRLKVEGLGLSADVKAKILAKDSARRKTLLCFFIEKGADVNAKDDDGSTPLHKAASAGHKEDVEWLIANGANLNLRDWLDSTPLDAAVMSGHKDIAKILRDKAVSTENSVQDEK